MDYNNQEQQNNWYVSSNTPYTPSAPETKKGNGMAIASMVLGITSIILCCTGFLSLPLGALGIMLALFTKRKGKSMPGMSVAGLVTSIFGCLLGLFVWVYIFFCMLLIVDPSLRPYVDPLFEESYGMTFEEYMEYSGYDLDQYDLDSY